MAIQNLDNVDSINNSTLFAVNQNGLDFNCTAAVVADFIQENTTLGDGKVIQYASPISASTVAISGTNNSVWLVLTPTGTLASLTILLPQVAGCVENQEILVNSTQTLTSLTVNLNGATGSGVPTSVSANGFFRLRFEPVLKKWYRVG
jgi:hypothetical protein